MGGPAIILLQPPLIRLGELNTPQPLSCRQPPPAADCPNDAKQGLRPPLTKLVVRISGMKRAKSGGGWYFKTGSYLQSNTDKGDAADAVGKVVLYRVEVTHSG